MPSTWTNWAGNERCVPAVRASPATREAVADAVVAAREAGRRVRVAGAGHSFSPAVVTDGTQLSLERLSAVLDADRTSGLVRVGAGITLRRLVRELELRGLALPNLGDIDAQSLAGALATGTHGTGAALPNLSAQVEEIELVLGDGSVRRLTAADGDRLRAARVGLGALGVVTAVTLRCVPAFRLRGSDRPEPLEDVLASLDERARADHFEFFTFPHSPVALTRTNTRTDEPPSGPGPAQAWVSDVLLDNHAFGALNRVARRRPGWVPALNRLMGRAASRRERVGRSYELFASPRLVRFVEMEYAVPRVHGAAAVRAARAILERHPISFPIEFRLGCGDDALLSPAYGRDTAYVAVHAFAGMPWEAAFREVEEAVAAWGGRPHWGKRSFLGAAELAGRHPGWDAFAAARAELDPEGRFASAWTDAVLGPVRAAASAPRQAPGRSPAPHR
jgi:L-gulono-1,4-lactone dehydrogenase